MLIGVPFFNQTLKISMNTDADENRKLAEKPIFDINNLDAYPEKYDQYYSDNFGFKVPLVRAMNYISKDIFHKSTLKGYFFIGKNNYVFEKRNNLPFFLGEDYFTETQLQKLAIEYSEREKYWESQGITPYILICPSKYSVYTNKLPVFLRTGRFKITDQFVKVIQENTNIKVVDGREILKERKKKHSVYQKFDTHWNSLGAFFCNYELLEHINENFPFVPLYTFADYTIDTIEHRNGNLRHALSSSNKEPEVDYKLSLSDSSILTIEGFKHIKPNDFPYSQAEYYQRYTSTINDSTLPKAIIFRDSYASITISTFPLHFSETLYIWDNWKYMFNKEILDIEKPDIIVYMIFEGFLKRVLLGPSFVEPEIDDKELQ